MAEQGDLGGFAGTVDSLDDDQLAAVTIRNEKRHSEGEVPIILADVANALSVLRSHWCERLLFPTVSWVLFHIRFRALIAIVLAACLPAAPQDTKPWSGILRDSAGAAIPSATVNLKSGTALSTAKTDTSGRFTFPAVTPGEYSISVEHNGTTALYAKKSNLPGTGLETVLQLSPDGTLSLIEDPGARQSTGGQQLSGKAVSSLPLNKRDFSQLLLLAAGTMTDTNGAANFTQQFAVNGQRGTAAVFAMDGADRTDPEMGGATFTNFNVDAVQEIQSSSGWMPAEIGRGAAGFTDIITRSGTNALHGSLFEFLRNSALDARNFFDQRSLADPRRIPPFIRNEFGFTIGGPVVIPGLYNGRDQARSTSWNIRDSGRC